MTSQIFVPYRAIGYVTTEVPFELKAENLQYSIMLSIGKSFQIINSTKLVPRMTSEIQEGKIRSMAFYKNEDYLTTCKNDILFWTGPVIKNRLSKHTSTVLKIMTFDNILISLSKNNELFMWDVDSKVAFKDQLPEFNAKTHKITSFVHPKGYFNKILIGFESGESQLWNLKTKKLLYTFKGWSSKIMCFEQSPVLDVLAFGLEDGRVIVHNIKQDKTVTQFQQQGPVTSVSFRTDGTSFMASSNPRGRVAIWDLEKKNLFKNLDAHEGSLSRVAFLREEPIMITNGSDNSIKVWAYHGMDGVPLVLRERSGHRDPPLHTQFYGETNEDIVSISKHSVRYMSSVVSIINYELSMKKKKNIPSFRDLSVNFRKDRIWETIVTSHHGSSKAYTWNCHARAVVKKLRASAPISSLKVSCCGNFAFLGTVGGGLHKYNIQSGIERAKMLKSIHKSPITSILVELTNQFVVTCGIDSTIHFWDFNTLDHLHTITLPQPITKMVLHEDSGIFAVVCDDMKLRLYDIETRELVREFDDINAKINDITFNHDGRWIIASTTDKIIRVFDIPSAKLIDWFAVSKPVTSISFSPLGEYLATTHTGELSVYLWSNQFHFGSVFLTKISETPSIMNLPNHLSDKIALDNNQVQEEALDQREFGNVPMSFDDLTINSLKDTNADTQKSTKRQMGRLITLSSDVPKSKWQSLLNLDIIKERNKPILQKAKPQLAPFFLTTVEGLQPKFATPDIVNQLDKEMKDVKPTTDQEEENEENGENEENLKGWDEWAGGEEDDEMVDEEGNPIKVDQDDEDEQEMKKIKKVYRTPKEIYKSDKVIKSNSFKATRTKFNLSLEDGYDKQNYSETLAILKEMSPSAIDFEIRSLTPNDNYADVHFMFDFITYYMLRNGDFDFVQSILNVCLKVHGYLLYTPPFQKDLKNLINSFNSWQKIQKIFHADICMLRYFTNTLNN